MKLDRGTGGRFKTSIDRRCFGCRSAAMAEGALEFPRPAPAGSARERLAQTQWADKALPRPQTPGPEGRLTLSPAAAIAFGFGQRHSQQLGSAGSTSGIAANGQDLRRRGPFLPHPLGRLARCATRHSSWQAASSRSASARRSVAAIILASKRSRSDWAGRLPLG
jgi:hypothetical protein